MAATYRHIGTVTLCIIIVVMATLCSASKVERQEQQTRKTRRVRPAGHFDNIKIWEALNKLKEHYLNWRTKVIAKLTNSTKNDNLVGATHGTDSPQQAHTDAVSRFDCKGKTDGIHYPDPQDCSAFWTCSFGTASKQLCNSDAGELFDNTLGTCNFASAVDCGAPAASTKPIQTKPPQTKPPLTKPPQTKPPQTTPPKLQTIRPPTTAVVVQQQTVFQCITNCRKMLSNHDNDDDDDGDDNPNGHRFTVSGVSSFHSCHIKCIHKYGSLSPAVG